jgi:glycosyltransferase involved in cell wall biosynthesis
VPSSFIRDQLAEHFDRDPSTITVTPMAAGSIFTPAAASRSAEVAERLGIEGPYLLAVGGARRRNLDTAIAAWRLASARLEEPLTLVVLGEPDGAAEAGLVRCLRLSDVDLPPVVAGARALVYPTRYEGFGMPALEAAACGTPVICARLASLPEVLGDAGAWAEAPEPEPVADVIVRLISDPGLRDGLSAASLAQAAAAPGWADTASTTLAAYERAAAG